jgi:hypothetical protein
MSSPTRSTGDSQPRDLVDIMPKPVGFRGLSPRAGPFAPPAVERRDIAGREPLARRIRAEFHEMPGLSLTLPQAMRLFGLSEKGCADILSALRAEGFLRRTASGGYARATALP